MTVISEFKQFILRGNVVDLAVGVVIGGAFGSVVKAFTADLITPLIGIPGKIADFSQLKFVVNKSTFMVGDFLNTLIAFVIIAGVVFFLVVKPMNWLASLNKTETAADDPTRECPECLSKIPILAKRCAYCTAEVPVSEGG